MCKEVAFESSWEGGHGQIIFSKLPFSSTLLAGFSRPYKQGSEAGRQGDGWELFVGDKSL